jgi:UrcA family protein
MKGTQAFALAFTAAALATVGLNQARAQPSEQLIVVAPAPPPAQTPDQLNYTQAVSFADLDLRTDWGAQTLGARINYAAEQSCRMLDRYYPDSTPIAAKAGRKDDCVAGAVYTAQPQFQAVVVAARQ